MTIDQEISLSVIVRVVGGGEFLQRCLISLLKQRLDQAIEIIVPYDATVEGIHELANQYPQVIFLELGEIIENVDSPSVRHDLYDLRSAAGMRFAKGQIIAQIEDYCVPGSNWCEQILIAHELPYAAIGGAVEHQGQHPINWATYFLDFGRYQLPLVEGPAQYLTDINITYKAKALSAIKDIWEASYNEVRTNWSLLKKGEILWCRPQMIVYQDRGKLSLAKAITERYYWGKIFGRIRSKHINWLQRLSHILFTPLLPAVMMFRIGKKVFPSRRNRSQFLGALGYIFVLAIFWSLGEFIGYCVTDNN
jgi:hypothetical protein